MPDNQTGGVPGQLADLFFASRTPFGRRLPDVTGKDAKAVVGPWKWRRKDPETGKSSEDLAELTDVIVARHMAGRLVDQGKRAHLLMYCLDAESRAVVTAIDLDVAGAGGHAESNPEHFASAEEAAHSAADLYDSAVQLGLTPWLERTKSGGSRVWIFHERPGVSGADAMALGKLLLNVCDLHPKIEVFPKQAKRTGSGTGSTSGGVFVPYWGGATAGCMVMIDPDTGAEIDVEAFAEAALESRAPADRVAEILRAARAAGRLPDERTHAAPEPGNGNPRSQNESEITDDISRRAWEFQVSKCEKLTQIVNDCEAGAHISYDEWFKLATQLHAYGEWGDTEFHRLSAFDDRYDAHQTSEKLRTSTAPTRCEFMNCGKHPHKDCHLPERNVSSIAFRSQFLRMRRNEGYKTAPDAEPLDPNDDRTLIETNHADPRDLGDATYRALLEGNRRLLSIDSEAFDGEKEAARVHLPLLFVRSGKISRIRIDEGNRASAEPVDRFAIEYRLKRVARFISTSDKRGQVTVVPPIAAVMDVLSRQEWGELPPLHSIVTAPIVAKDGKIITTPGYNPSARVYFHPQSALDIGETTPTAANIAAAKSLIIDDFLGDFPFVNQASRAHAVGLMILPFVRTLIDGFTPLHLIDAPTPRTGKGLLAEVCTAPFIPGGVAVMTAPDTDDEWRKRITSTLAGAPSHVLIDNLAGPLKNKDLCGVITAGTWEDRVLGTSSNVHIDARCVWLATANNANLSDEIAGRTVWIRLNPNREDPGSRNDFRRPEISHDVHSERGRLVTAIFTLVRCWLSQGRPPAERGVTMGRFSEWVSVIGGMLRACEIPGFLDNRRELLDKSDITRQAWRAFVNAWRELFGPRLVGVAELMPTALEFLSEQIGDRGTERGQQVRFGAMLRKMTDQVFEDYQICRSDDYHRAAQYQLLEASRNMQSCVSCVSSTLTRREYPDTNNLFADTPLRSTETDTRNTQDYSDTFTEDLDLETGEI